MQSFIDNYRLQLLIVDCKDFICNISQRNNLAMPVVNLAITNALVFTRQYISEFETGFSTRLTNAQLKKLRTYYEEKIADANNNGEDITPYLW